MSNTTKSVFRVLGVIAAVLLSIALVIMLIVAPLYSAVTSVTKPSTITGIIQSIDFGELLFGETVDSTANDSPDDQASAVLGATSEEITDTALDIFENGAEDAQQKAYLQSLLQSPLAKDILGIYMEDAIAIINGDKTDISLDKATLLMLLEEHMDSIIAILRENSPTPIELTDEQIRQEATKLMEQHAEDLITALPGAQEINTIAEEIRTNPVLTIVFNRAIPFYLYGVIALLAVLIFFCLYGRARGLLCLGIDALIACVPLFVVAVIFGNGALLVSSLGLEELSAVMLPLISTVGGKILLAAILLAVCGALGIGGYIGYGIYLKKKAAAPTDSVDALPLEAN